MEENTTLTKKENNEQKYETLIAVAVTAVISVLISFTIFHFFFLSDGRYEKLKQMDSLVEKHFYGEVDKEKLSDTLMMGYVAGLGDKYAYYYSSEEASLRNDSLAGSGQGIGIIVVQHPDSGNIYVKNVYHEGPADKAGIKVGDEITAIDSVSVTERGYQQSVNDIIRELGETVTVTVLRDGKTRDIKVEYSRFIAQTVFGQMLDSGVAYVEITSFNGGTYTQFKNTVDSLVSEGAKGIIFDLRGNGGGPVNSVTQMVDYLCPEGVIMTAKYANGDVKVVAESDASEIELPMAVLTNAGTASASEIFTASIKDFGKGISVGSMTFGKGVMQSTYAFSDGSDVVFTVAEFFPYSGKSFNGKGIEPDIEVTLTEEQQKYMHQTALADDPVVVAAEAELLK